MFVPKSLKLNKFRFVTIPKNHTYFQRFGFGMTPQSAFSGDEKPLTGNKTDVLAEMEKRLNAEVSD